MSCILCSPEECATLAVRIMSQDLRVIDNAASLATWENRPHDVAELARALYAENLRAFVDRYEGRHLNGVAPADTIPKVPEVEDACNIRKLYGSLRFFMYQCSEGSCFESPVYRFLRCLRGELAIDMLPTDSSSSWAIV